MRELCKPSDFRIREKPSCRAQLFRIVSSRGQMLALTFMNR
jgi:hypothetical protein